MEPEGTWQGESHRYIRRVSPIYIEGAGGIVDIEFIAQILLLVRQKAPAATSLQHQGSYTATPGATAEEGVSLLAHYGRFREVEKRLRMTSDRADTALPTAAGDLRALARTVGAQERGALEKR